MIIAILGTGMVGRTLAEKLAQLGHGVRLGTRVPAETLARVNEDGLPMFADWLAGQGGIGLRSFAQAVRGADLVVNALNGQASLAGLKLAGAENLGEKVLMDVANPLDFSAGMPPSLFVANTDSLGEVIQREFPDLRVVKALNSVPSALMVDPQGLAGGAHSVFVAGNDEGAKAIVRALLEDGFGWSDIIDLGDITNARGTEAMLLLWVRLWGKVSEGTGFSFKVVR